MPPIVAKLVSPVLAAIAGLTGTAGPTEAPTPAATSELEPPDPSPIAPAAPPREKGPAPANVVSHSATTNVTAAPVATQAQPPIATQAPVANITVVGPGNAIAAIPAEPKPAPEPETSQQAARREKAEAALVEKEYAEKHRSELERTEQQAAEEEDLRAEAAKQQQAAYLLGGNATRWGGFGGLHLRFAGVGGSFGMFVGGGGGLHFRTGNIGATVGAAVYGLTLSSTRVDDGTGQRRNIDLGYGGIVLGMSYVAPKFWEVGGRTLLGGGGLCMFGAGQADATGLDRGCTLSGTVMVIEPEAVTHLRLTERFRMTLALGYRFTIPPWEQSRRRSLSGPSGLIGFEWGAF
ncbi:MAG: hypothetical protein V3V08_21650 [Nannocystaceae bacterium]